jgi:hypothetical protein
MTMNTNITRVLGRILAVEETMAVSGAKPTTPCRDNITSLISDTSPSSEYCKATPVANGTSVGTNISMTLTHTNGT